MYKRKFSSTCLSRSRGYCRHILYSSWCNGHRRILCSCLWKKKIADSKQRQFFSSSGAKYATSRSPLPTSDNDEIPLKCPFTHSQQTILNLGGGLELRKPDTPHAYHGGGLPSKGKAAARDPEVVSHYVELLEEWCSKIRVYLDDR